MYELSLYIHEKEKCTTEKEKKKSNIHAFETFVISFVMIDHWIECLCVSKFVNTNNNDRRALENLVNTTDTNQFTYTTMNLNRKMPENLFFLHVSLQILQ